MNVIGLDLGTTTLSAVVVDSATGAVLETMNIPNGASLPGEQAFDRIQDAAVIAEKSIALVEALKDQGNHSLMLEVRVSNEPARKLYEKLGFTQVGLRKNYYRNPREDACILRKEWEI